MTDPENSSYKMHARRDGTRKVNTSQLQELPDHGVCGVVDPSSLIKDRGVCGVPVPYFINKADFPGKTMRICDGHGDALNLNEDRAVTKTEYSFNLDMIDIH